ncbi:phosphoenolpyruvate carboxykinase [Chenggangzhangella methanolivorans]|uniref:Phosphoenolpyruvate carboxykinase (ATP) n=1 Tax=Chenggangzhangella methanolivorans TaxID=1437009 RepID=A0A9E6REY6_9HYPH|nr:phosphoenolpyruvate carboxykinase [Chenggangzhangella methanolivorans]QZO02289.1 phosphoenolpyruvate carboxykinase [Chenggangzhangella methanolivorans]
MRQTGVWNASHGAEAFGFEKLGGVNWNLPAAVLVERAVRRGEAQLSASGALTAETGVHTGRSPKDKFVVRDESTENEVEWTTNASMTPEQFENLRQDFLAHAQGRELFAQDLYGGADAGHRLPVRVYTEYAWHSMFIATMLIQPKRDELEGFVPKLTILDFPSFTADPARHGSRGGTIIAVDFTQGIVLIGGTSYAGEMKKSVFTFLNYLLPKKGVMPMHCSANVGEDGSSAVFFGLSGTGKTTLSADPARALVGDDEHGWGPEGIFNFEGGCYAKTIRLTAESEPEIFAAAHRFGAILENVPLSADTREPDFDDVSKTENTRVAYPLKFIPNANETGKAGHPKNIVMLTCDAFGVLPPISKLTPAQAMYHFLSGYTAKVAGTEKGVTEPQATFSTCFGAPFMPRNAAVYGELLKSLIAEHGVDCWLVNTGWTGGGFGSGKRISLKATRALLTAALDGSLKDAEFRAERFFGLEVPNEVEGVDASILRPRRTWADKAAYDAAAAKLRGMFQANFRTYEGHVDDEVRAAGPQEFREAAE